MHFQPIKIFVPDGENFVFPDLHTHSLPFDIESDYFVATNSFSECDAVPIAGGTEPDDRLLSLLAEYPDKLLFLFVFSHVCEGDHVNYQNWYLQWQNYSKNLCVVTTNYQANKIFHRAHNYDFLFNRHKAYYLDFDSHVKDSKFLDINEPRRLWSNSASHRMYSVPLIEKIDTGSEQLMLEMRKFIVPNKNDIVLHADREATVHLHERTMYRHLFIEYAQSCGHQAYCADWSKTPPITLACQEPGIMNPDGSNYAGWWPISNSYYNSSVINAYVETLVNDNQVRCVTEKTFEPMIKGNFILPFGYQGLVSDIVNQYGFKLPDWIDYSYDTVSDRTERFYLYTREFIRIRDQLSIKDLIDLRNRDLHILEHNRQVFSQSPYQSLYNILKPYLIT